MTGAKAARNALPEDGARNTVSRGLDRGAVLPTYARADVTIVRGKGCRVWDDTGRAYLDFGGGIAVTGLGHRHPRVTAAAHAQLDALWHASNLYWTEPMLRLAELLSARMGGAQAFFCSSGAEANEAALKVARKATGRTRLVALEESFHGRTLGALSVTGQPAKWDGFGPLVPGVSFARPNDVESLEAAVSPGAELAAIVLEPVLGEGGIVPLEQGFVEAAAEITREVGALLWVDEVQTGVGRTGTFFGYEQLGLEPDLVTLAKGLGNGLPVGALLVRPGAADAVGPGDHGATFGGNTVNLSTSPWTVDAATATLDVHALLPPADSLLATTQPFDNFNSDPNSTVLQLAYNGTNPRFSLLLQFSASAFPRTRRARALPRGMTRRGWRRSKSRTGPCPARASATGWRGR